MRKLFLTRHKTFAYSIERVIPADIDARSLSSIFKPSKKEIVEELRNIRVIDMVKAFLDNPSNVEHYPNMAKLMRMYITGSVSNADVERGASHITSLNHTLFTCINGPSSEEFNKSGLALRIARYYIFRRRRNVVTEGRLISPDDSEQAMFQEMDNYIRDFQPKALETRVIRVK